MCGEKSSVMDRMRSALGSPPRVRGKVSISDLYLRLQRITPACAGKSAFRVKVSHGCGDHPRVCGEKAASVLLDDVVLGSPPRVRGKALSQYTTTKTAGITPACAGKRVDINTNDGVLEDHPRVCGEK